jgi:glyoxylase-like metal-dependent hydrolase (beta-lactamase superfamily II)
MTGERNKSMRKILSTENFKIHVFGTDDNSFNVTAVILQKEADAYLINAGFTKAAANELVDFINTEKLNLKGAFIIHGDPDYYFGMEQILRSVPKLEILSTEETQQHIAESVVGKLAVWSSVLQEQAPVNVILPKAVTGDKLNILGTEFEFVGDDKNRINLFEKNEKLLIGGIDIFNELHIFLADTGSEEKLQAWIDRLTSLEALNPEIVIPSHADLNASFDKKALSATKEYLQKAIAFTKASSSSEELAASLKTAYPDYINTGVIDLGAKVLLGEIQWG